MKTTPTQDTTIVEPEGGIWTPLRNRLFALLILVHLGTQFGVFMNGLGAAWVLTDITDSPALISALSIAVSLPTFLLALVTGALADIVSRKKIIVFSQAGSVVVAGVFALLSAADGHTTLSILGLTTALGVFSAVAAPAWLAIIPGLVPRQDLAGAMTLSSAGISAAMAVGPAVGGFLIAGVGATWIFVVNSVVFIAGLVALRSWEPDTRTGLPAEHLMAAIRGGLQYVRYDRPLRVVIAKVIPFALTGVALVSLLPAVARFRLDAGPAMFGVLSGAGGVGAVIALLLLPRIRKRIGPDAIVTVAMALEAGVFVVMASTTNLTLAAVALAVAGGATLSLVSTVMTMLQIVLPAWIRGRGVAVYLFALQGSFALGALLWGAVAEATSLESAFLIAAAAMGVSAVATLFLRLRDYVDTATDPGQLQFEPVTATSVHDDDGPIVVSVAWQIPTDARERFLEVMQATRQTLKRQGALNWQLAEDVTRPGALVESFTVATWSEYQRLPKRATVADAKIEQELQDVVGGSLPNLVAHRVLDLRGQPRGQ